MAGTTMSPVKLDYSRLLDDEFLNRGERVRVHTVAKGAASVLGSSASLASLTSLDWKGSQCTTALLKVALALTLMAALAFVGLLVAAHQHHVGQLQALAMPVQAEAGPASLEHAEESASTLHVQAGGTLRHPEGDAHHADDGLHDHVFPGDVVVEEHHILPADEPEPTRHAVVVCLPLPAEKPTPPSTAAHNATASAAATDTASADTGDFPLRLSRHQRDVVQSVTEYLAASARCHIVVLRGVADDEDSAASSSTASSTAPSRGPARVFAKLGHTGCGPWPGQDDDEGEDDAGAEPGGSLHLPGGKVVPVVLWDAPALFARSPLAEVWHDLHWRRAKGAAMTADSRASASTELLDLAARLQLLWRYGGVSVDLQSSADQVLKALSAFNRTDSSHVYLETTRGALIAAPQTCNAVVFDLIQAISKQARRHGPPTGHADDDDDGDVRAFDGVLNDYCRSRRTPRQADAGPTSTTTAPTSTESAVLSSTTSTTTPNLLARMKGAMAFGLLRAGPPAVTTTPHPDPQDIRLDTTQCRGNLVAISLS